MPVFKRLVKQEPRVQIWIVGNNDAFSCLLDIPIENKRLFPVQPYGPYLATIKQLDVFAIPLSGKYDRCRSWIKPLEAALMSVPWVATRNRIYRECQGGVLVKTKQQWEEALMSPIAADRDWAMQQDIVNHIEEYVDVFSGNSDIRREGR